MPLLNEASNAYLGTQLVDAIYRGDVKVWPTKIPQPFGYWDFENETNANDFALAMNDWGGPGEEFDASISNGILSSNMKWYSSDLDFPAIKIFTSFDLADYPVFTHLSPKIRFKMTLPGVPSVFLFSSFKLNESFFQDQNWASTQYPTGIWHDFVVTGLFEYDGYDTAVGDSIPMSRVEMYPGSTVVDVAIMVGTWLKNGDMDLTIEVETVGFVDKNTGQPIQPLSQKAKA